METYRLRAFSSSRWFYGLLFLTTLAAVGLVLGPFPQKSLILLALPALLLWGLFCWYQPRQAFYGLLLVLPLSQYWHLGGSKLSIPGELGLAVLGLTGLVQWSTGLLRPLPRWRHPISLLVGGYLFWLVLSGLFSTMPLVTLKYLVLQMGYMAVFYFLLTAWLRQPRHWQWLPLLYTLPVLLLVAYTTWRHAGFGFVPQVNSYVPTPFFNDHTIYGAVLALLLPFWLTRLLQPRKNRLFPHWVLLGIIGVLLTGIFLSYSRAVWISTGVMLFLGLFIALRLKVRYLLLGAAIVGGLFYQYRMPLLARLHQVRSERGAGVAENLVSAANISSSVSNLERLNRWQAALNMFAEKPLLGFGPGTYPMQYGTFQDPDMLTRLSTFMGDAGGVHSEYLKPLTEAGWPALLLFGAILVLSFWRGLRLCYRAPDANTRLLAAAFVLGLAGYWTHGFFNFFLDTAKTALLHWGFIAGIVALEAHLAAGPPKEMPHANQ